MYMRSALIKTIILFVIIIIIIALVQPNFIYGAGKFSSVAIDKYEIKIIYVLSLLIGIFLYFGVYLLHG